MHRTTIVALVAAGVVGIASGALVAIQRSPSDQTSGIPSAPITSQSSPASGTPSGPTSEPSPTPTISDEPGPGALLYADSRKIHDGRVSVSYDVPPDLPTPLRRPDRLIRIDGGYLLTFVTSTEDVSSLLLYAVSTDGVTHKVAEVADDWDIDEGGTRIVGTDVDSGLLQVWDTSGQVIATASRPVPRSEYLDPVWSGDVVLMTGRAEEQHTSVWPVWRWDPDAKSPKRTDEVGMARWSASADGAQLLGTVGIEGLPTDHEGNVCLRMTSTPGAPRVAWQTCDWRLNAPHGEFSPRGARVLAIPADSDGFGPGRFVTLSTTEGPAAGVNKIDVPALTVDAQWLDDAHIIVRSRTDDELDEDTGTVLTRCDLAGSCQVVLTRPRSDLVLGEQ